MRTKIILLLVLVLGVSLHACKQKENAEGESCAPLNPNGDSELALLMRKMAKLNEDNAAALRAGKELVPYDGSFEKEIYTAQRSMKVEEDFFQGMAKSYIGHLNKLYAAGPTDDKAALHNNVVQACQDCHGQTCRGPLKRIDKMLVK
ncbi:MAG: hypothetical protein U0Y08_08280 [Bacteroidia bacterium]